MRRNGLRICVVTAAFFCIRHTFFRHFSKKISMDLSELLSEDSILEMTDSGTDSESRKRPRESSKTPPQPMENTLCSKFAPSKICKYGQTCKLNKKAQCSFVHSDSAGLEKAFCICTSSTCEFPHPLRRRQIVCTKCGGSHTITFCPKVQCTLCLRYGHIARNCRN